MDRRDINLTENPQELHADVSQRLPNLEKLLNKLLALQSPRLFHLKSLLAE